MTVFEIRDNAYHGKKLVGYLFYYENSNRFFSELLSELDEWDAPFIFSGFVKKGVYSIDSEWSMKFVRQRIVPHDRQNIGQILKENKMDYYDEYGMLVLSEGRCSQDELYLVNIGFDKILPEINGRLEKNVYEVIPKSNYNVMVIFKDGEERKLDIAKVCGKEHRFDNVLRNMGLFEKVRVSPGGHGIEWGEERFIRAGYIYEYGQKAE